MATPAAAPAPPSPAAATPTPLWAVLAFSFVNSIGTGLVTSGIFYLTDSGYHFSRTANLALGLLLGATYIAGAAGAGPALRRLRARLGAASGRTVLVVLMLAMGALCVLPWAGARNGAGPLSIWLLVGLYSPLTGVLWPMIESFLSGGRSGENLRSAVGTWNIVWSSALVLAFWGMAGFVRRHPAEVILVLGALHGVSAMILAGFPRDPAPHIAEHHDPHPPVYAQLLTVFRMLLPLGYIATSALGPILPAMMRGMGVAEEWRPILGSAWLLPRCAAFAVLQRWQGWHGRWAMPVAGMVLLLGGFGAAVLSPLLGPSDLAVAMMVGGLAVFGTGMAVIYTAAIYYALEVGQAEVEAGGTHEALIGVGYTLGPLCGLGATALIGARVLDEGGFQVAVLGTVGALAAIVGVVAARRALREAAVA